MHPVAYGRTAELHGPAESRGGVDPRLKPAAHEFEASLLQELLKPMERDPLFSGNSSGGGLATGDAGMSNWSSLGAQSLAKAISDAGGLGIATKMIQAVEAEAQEKTAGKMTAPAAGAGDLRAGAGSGSAGIPLSATKEHLQAWSAVRRLP